MQIHTKKANGSIIFVDMSNILPYDNRLKV